MCNIITFPRCQPLSQPIRTGLEGGYEDLSSCISLKTSNKSRAALKDKKSAGPPGQQKECALLTERFAITVAKQSVLSMLEELQALGIELTDDQKAKVEEVKVTAFENKAKEIFARKLSRREVEGKDNKVAAETDEEFASRVADWTERFMTLAREFDSEIDKRETPKGRGFVEQHLVGIDTPVGHLKVELTRTVDKK